jgi:serine/threonine protein kinase
MIPKFPRGFSHPMRIGTGAFASVYRVRQAALDRWVALKFIYEKNGVKRRELLSEARTQAKMHMECVPQLYDAFEWRQSICMVMEWIRGVSLSELLECPLSTGERVALAGAVLQAFAMVHEQGFAHRDLKPENVIITPDGALYLVDFGFSKQVTRDMKASSVTTAKGTPAYMAPELWKYGSQVDLMRADVYAAGKVLAQILVSTPHVSIVDSLLDENPKKRPASGKEVLALWHRDGTQLNVAGRWREKAGELLAERLSRSLLSAAKTLLYARRGEEAYRLLVESLEENGDNHEALDLMTTFRELSRKRTNMTYYLLFMIVLAGGVGVAFIAGVRSRDQNPVVRSLLGKDRMAQFSSGTFDVSEKHVSLRVDSLHTDKLSGRLAVRSISRQAKLFIDNNAVAPDSAHYPGFLLHWGEHTITVTDTAGNLLQSRRVKLLPFQFLAVDMNQK